MPPSASVQTPQTTPPVAPRERGTSLSGGLKILPHEVVFQAFLLITWIRLVRASGFREPLALMYASFVAVAVLLVMLTTRAEHEWGWRLRLLYYPLVMNATYFYMAPVVFKIHHGPLLDASLRHIDSLLIGQNLSLRLEPYIRPAFTEPLSFCYMLYIPYLTFSMLWYLFGSLALLKRFYLGLFTLYGLGFLGYTFVPAAGPYLAMTREFHVPFAGWFFTHWNAEMVRFGSNGVDVFPSLHCAVSSYMLFFDGWYKKWRFRIYALPCIGLWFSTIYLRYHYLIDVIVGFGLAACVLYLTRRWRIEE